MEEVKKGDQFEDMERRHKGKVRIVEVIKPDVAGRALCAVYIDGRKTGKTTLIQRRRLADEHKRGSFRRVKSVPQATGSSVGPMSEAEIQELLKRCGHWKASHPYKRLIKNVRQLQAALQMTLQDRDHVYSILRDVRQALDRILEIRTGVRQ